MPEHMANFRHHFVEDEDQNHAISKLGCVASTNGSIQCLELLRQPLILIE
jgi:hypothetical protein